MVLVGNSVEGAKAIMLLLLVSIPVSIAVYFIVNTLKKNKWFNIEKEGGILLTSQEKQKLYNEALAFYELAEYGRMHMPEQKHVESHIPYIINMTFCSELLLKFLLIEEGKNIEYLKK